MDCFKLKVKRQNFERFEDFFDLMIVVNTFLCRGFLSRLLNKGPKDSQCRVKGSLIMI